MTLISFFLLDNIIHGILTRSCIWSFYLVSYF